MVGVARQGGRLEQQRRVGGSVDRLQVGDCVDVASIGDDCGELLELFQLGCHVGALSSEWHNLAEAQTAGQEGFNWIGKGPACSFLQRYMFQRYNFIGASSAAFQQAACLIQQRQWVFALVDIHREQLAKASGTRKALAQSEHMSGDMVHRTAFLQVSLNVRPHPCQCVGAADGWLGFAEQAGVHLRQQIGVVVGLTSEHHTIEALQMSFAFVQSLDASVEDDFQFGEVRLQLLRDVVAQWWDLTILFRREAFENGDSRVYGKAAAAGVSYLADKITQLGIAVATVDADSMLRSEERRGGQEGR